MITLLLCALGLTAVTVIMHGVGAAAASRRAMGLLAVRADRSGRLSIELLLVRLVSLLLLLHLAEAVVWALFFVQIGALPERIDDFNDTFHVFGFSAQAFTNGYRSSEMEEFFMYLFFITDTLSLGRRMQAKKRAA